MRHDTREKATFQYGFRIEDASPIDILAINGDGIIGFLVIKWSDAAWHHHFMAANKCLFRCTLHRVAREHFLRRKRGTLSVAAALSLLGRHHFDFRLFSVVGGDFRFEHQPRYRRHFYFASMASCHAGNAPASLHFAPSRQSQPPYERRLLILSLMRAASAS